MAYGTYKIILDNGSTTKPISFITYGTKESAIAKAHKYITDKHLIYCSRFYIKEVA